jgi:hypothetical protein
MSQYKICFITEERSYPPYEDNSSIDTLSFHSNSSLADYDIILLNSDSYYSDNLRTTEEYQGKNIYEQSMIDSLKHWKVEINEAIKSAKLVIIILGEFEEFCVYTGEYKYTGKLKNNVVTPLNSLGYLASSLSPRNSQGKTIKLANNSDTVIKNLYDTIKKYAEYKILINNNNNIVPLFLTKENKVIGGWNDNILFLPYINFNHDDFFEEEKGEDGETRNYWSNKSLEFMNSFIDKIVAIKKNMELEEILPPEWIKDIKYKSKNEQSLNKELNNIKNKIEKLQIKQEEMNPAFAPLSPQLT